MKKILLTLFLSGILLSAKSQKVIITGVMFDPQGADAPKVGTVAGNYTHLGGYEYIQLMATQNIDFSQNPHSVVRSTNSGTTAGAPDNGWAETSSARTFKFSITSGTVNKGEFFYVGGPEKTAGGFIVESGIYYPVLDMSGSKWLRTIAYSSGNTDLVGDDNIGMGTTGLLTNTVKGASSRPVGIAVFEGTVVGGLPNNAITVNSVPVDAIFIGYSNNNVLAGAGSPTHDRDNIYLEANAPNNCYRVPQTDRYTAGYMGDVNNQYVYSGEPSADLGYFLKLSGDFDLDTKTWSTPRTANYVQLVPPAGYGTAAQRTSFATLDMIEGSAAGYNGTSVPVITLPVSLTTFTAKANKAGTVNLAWSTASEQNNSHFDVLRATDGVSFNKVGHVTGNGTSNAINNYSFTDAKPVNGTNYYRLKQVDNDGESAQSKVVSVKVSLSASKLTVAVSGNRSAVKVNYEATTAGNAIFTIYNTSGVKIASSTQSVNAGTNQITIPVTLGNAIHILKVSQAGVASSVKF